VLPNPGLYSVFDLNIQVESTTGGMGSPWFVIPEYPIEKRCKTFGNAQVALSGIELANKIKKGQFDTSEITSPGAMILQVWEAALAA
jgi:hypothetical protein